MGDPVNHPAHYEQDTPCCDHCGKPVECIVIAEQFNFNRGNAIKYVWRAGKKTDSPLQDLRKAVWYLSREIKKIEGTNKPTT
jgi:hypothetical protein